MKGTPTFKRYLHFGMLKLMDQGPDLIGKYDYEEVFFKT